jgi:hypothetical protein
MLISTSLAAALHAEGPAADRAKELELYAFLVGQWRFEVTAYGEKGVAYKSRGEIHAGWALEGRAIQDVWSIAPPGTPVTGAWYGTTLRVYDPARKVWNIHWIDPATGFAAQMVGRAQGADIVQEGRHESGALLRWSFSEITPGAFRWRGEVSRDDGKTWHLQVDIRAERVR